MKIHELTIGLKIRHPQYGFGIVKKLDEHTAEIRFDDGLRTVDPEMSGITPGEPVVEAKGLDVPLKSFVETIVESMVAKLGIEKPDSVIQELGARWNAGKLVPLEVFFHKVVGIRNQLRVLEQKINAHEKLTDGEKIEMQQYITRCYGSLTTFNILFKEKEGQF